MNEPTSTRLGGPDVAWTGWRAAADQVDAPRPDAVRPEAAVGRADAPNPSGPPSAPDHKDDAATVPENAAAVFPTSYARFAIDSETQRLSIKIVDAVTDEVIREIPSEQVQRIAQELQASARRHSIGRRPSGAVGVDAPANGGVDRYV